MTQNAMTAVCVLLACQGFVGSAQYAMELPPGMVWIHVVLAGAARGSRCCGRRSPSAARSRRCRCRPSRSADAAPPLVRTS